MHGNIRERKEIPNDVKLLTFQFCYAEAHKHKSDTSVKRWDGYLCLSLKKFLVIPVKKSDTSVKYKR